MWCPTLSWGRWLQSQRWTGLEVVWAKSTRCSAIIPQRGGRCGTQAELAAVFLSWATGNYRGFYLKCGVLFLASFFIDSRYSRLQPIWLLFGPAGVSDERAALTETAGVSLSAAQDEFAEDKAKFVPAMIGMCEAEDGVALGLPGCSAGASCGSGLDICSKFHHSALASLIYWSVNSYQPWFFIHSVLSTRLLTSLFPPPFIVGSRASDQSFPASMILIIYCRLCRVKSCIPLLGSAFRPVLCIFDKIIF